MELPLSTKIEDELDSHTGATNLKSFIATTRQEMKVVEASRILGVTPEYACRSFERTLVNLLAEKLAL
jgi:hypothetical protein